MSQKDNVIDAIRRNGGYATLQQLNQIVDFSTWKTKMPQASIRRIVQIHDEFLIERRKKMAALIQKYYERL